MPSPDSPAVAGDSSTSPPAAVGSGARLVIGLLLLGITAGVVGIWYQRGQTRRCLAFYGPEAARMVTSAPVVEVWTLAPTAESGVLVAVKRADVSQAPGLVHLRRGLVEDANFRWQGRPSTEAGRLPAESWDRALVFADPAAGRPPVVLVIDLVEGASAAAGVGVGELGSLAVVGRPGRIGLGRISRGLERWLRGQP
jgi:hypothetical protein